MSESTHDPAAMPVTMADLVRDFKHLGIAPGMTLLVHSSMRTIGWVNGGAVAVVLALEEALGPNGTLVMPAHTSDLSDPAHWSNPPVPESWWDIIRHEAPAFDATWTPSRRMGAIAEAFRTQPGTWRSDHPHVSFVARGPNATTIVADHSLAAGLGDELPLSRLYDLDARVLLLGLGYNNNTSLHLAEYRADFPGKRTMRQGASVLRDGRPQWVAFDDLDWNDEDFVAIGEAFNAETGLVQQGKVGKADVVMMPQRALVDFGVRWMEKHRGRTTDDGPAVTDSAAAGQ